MKIDQSQLWSFTVVSPIHKNIDLVRNNFTGQLMLRRLSDEESLPVLKELCAINHPNIMRVYDAQLMDGICVSLCEYINGVTLAYNIENNGPCSVSEAKKILVGVCNGLSELHGRYLVHRDIKPENIMLDGDGSVKIIDFSITRLIKPDKNKDTSVLGTEGYAAPEQFGFGQTNGRADIYACGVLLNVLLTGKLPGEELHQGQLTTVIERCIEIDATKRFSSADDLKKTLQGRKLNKRRSFRALPGYRGKRVFPKIITTIFIAAWLFMMFVMLNGLGMTLRLPVKFLVRWIVMFVDFMLLWSAVPYILFGDMFRLSERINPDNSRNGKYILRILGVVSILLGIALFVWGVYFTNQL